MRAPQFLGLACCLASGCLINVDYSGSTFTCEDSPECPEGFVCDQGQCRNPVDLACSDDWFNCEFSRRTPLSFDHREGVEDLVDFPVLVRVDSSVIDHDQTNDDGSDLRFVDETGNVLAHEIERWDETSGSAVWVKLPVLPAGEVTTLYMYYGNSEAADTQDRTAVWDERFVAVYHLGGAIDAPHRDSTVNANAGTSIGMAAEASSPGFTGGAVTFDGVDDWIEIPHSDSLAIPGDQVTLSAWINPSAVQVSDAGIVVKSTDGAGYDLQLGVQTGNSPNFRVFTEAQTYLTGPTVLPTDQWQFLAGVYDGSQARVIVDGAVDATEAQAGNLTVNTDPVVIGRRELGDERFFIGSIDEVRISNVARSQDWLTTSFRSMTGALLTIGAEQTRE